MQSSLGRSLPDNWKTPYFTIWIGQAFSLLGSQLVQFALIWWLTSSTGSATVLAIASLVGLLPQVLLGPIAGALVDRWSRRAVMILADGAIALATVGLVLVFWAGQVQIWQVYLVMFIRALGGGFHWPAMQASTSLMVPKEHLARIQGLNQVLTGAMSIGAAPLGALLLGFLAMPAILAIDVITAFLAISTLFFVSIPQPKPSIENGEANPPASVWQDLRAGLRYVWAWPGLVMLLVMATLINFLLTPASALQPILVTKHFAGGPLQLAWMESSWGFGMVLGGLTLSIWGGFRRRILTSLAGLIGLGAANILVGLASPSAFPLAVTMVFVVGFMVPIINGPILAAMQAAVAPEMQGRVFTLINSAATAMSPLSLVVAGPAADIFGVQSWFVVGGILTALLGLAGFFIPAIVHLEDGQRTGIASRTTNQPAVEPDPKVRLSSPR